MRNRYRRVRGVLPLLLLLACSGAPSDGGAPVQEADASECARATARLEQLQLASLEKDPVLAQFPDLAREHARQTRDVFVKPVAARCSGPAFVQCVQSAETFAQAASCK